MVTHVSLIVFVMILHCYCNSCFSEYLLWYGAIMATHVLMIVFIMIWRCHGNSCFNGNVCYDIALPWLRMFLSVVVFIMILHCHGNSCFSQCVLWYGVVMATHVSLSMVRQTTAKALWCHHCFDITTVNKRSANQKAAICDVISMSSGKQMWTNQKSAIGDVINDVIR